MRKRIGRSGEGVQQTGIRRDGPGAEAVDLTALGSEEKSARRIESDLRCSVGAGIGDDRVGKASRAKLIDMDAGILRGIGEASIGRKGKGPNGIV